MANEEHLAILRQSGAAWNKWRDEHPEVHPDLKEANLKEANLIEANLIEANLRGADLREADLRRANLIEANLIEADLREADLRRAYLIEANLIEANLSRADLSEANLKEADLSGADLSRADLSEANLSRATLSRADLSKANLSRATLSGANLSRATLSEAKLNSTVFGDVDLSETKGLDAIRHFGPSIIGIDTIYRSKGKIPDVFLRGTGVPDTFIEYMASLVGKPIDFYSCFISYSSKDQEFADRLYADLQSKGVRCWFATEDLKIGDRFRDRIHESIRVYEKLLVILSETSVASDWVEEEVTTAMDKEAQMAKRQGGRPTVLFPVCLDSAAMDTQVGWAATIRRTRHIGDFTRWKEHDAYQKALERLLRDLKTAARQDEAAS